MAHVSQEYIQKLYDELGDLKVLDDIVRHRAADKVQVPILGYPKSESSVSDYELFTGQQLDSFIDATVKYLLASGLKAGTREVIAILAPSDITYVVTFFALSRLGYAVLALSLRIPPVAIINLLKKTCCSTIVHGHSDQIEKTLQDVKRDLPIRLLKTPTREIYGRPSEQPPFFREFDRQEENEKIALILHSSGSTGLPKPISLRHKAMLTHPPQGSGLHNFNTLPWYHMYGLSTSLQAMWMRKTAHMFSASSPMTAENLISVVEAVKPQAIHAVPYALGLLAEKERGLAAMKACKMVTAAGARTPDELGDLLVSEGINVGVVFGSTEASLIGDTMHRDKGDNSWNYIRLYTSIRNYIYMNPLGNDLYECVYLKGHPALCVSNSDDPAPGSFHSKDVFTPHPTIPDVWKYVTRIDDRITLLNGEKVLPLPIEGCIRGNPLVREAVVVGIDQAIPGLLIFRAREGDSLSEQAYIDAVWPSIEEANSRAEGFSQITRDMVTVMPSNVDYPQTDKGSVIRAQVYNKFASQITDMYARLEGNQEGRLKLELPALEAWIMKSFQDTAGVPLESPTTDFFEAGVDSLRAIQMRRIIQKTLELHGTSLNRNIVYELGDARSLARYLYAIGQGCQLGQEDELSLMKDLVDKYSSFSTHRYMNGVTNGYSNGATDILTNGFKHESQAVILTGATGSIGAHVLSKLLKKESVSRIYCFVRGSGSLQRVIDSMQSRGVLPKDRNLLSKITAFVGDLQNPEFGASDPSVYAQMLNDVGLIIHVAWPVNFNISLSSFEPHIAGLHNLLQFSLAVHRHEPARLLFCSSISTAFRTKTPASIPEAPIEDFSQASRTGYGQSKLVGEQIVRNAARIGANTDVLRIGQVVGDQQNGIWNDTEFIPSIIRSALALRTLPSMPNERCFWLPVDTLATSILEFAHRDSASKPSAEARFHNLVSPHSFDWDTELLPTLRFTALGDFAVVSFQNWLRLLQQSALQEEDEAKNPAIKLLEYFAGDREGFEGRGVVFETKVSQRDSEALRNTPDILKEGYLERFMESWLEKWAS